MFTILLRLPEVQQEPQSRPQVCPHCQGETFQGWGKVRKAVRDSRYCQVSPHRCCQWRRVFRHYPQGVDGADQRRRMRVLAALLWGLGLSLRGVVLAFTMFAIQLSCVNFLFVV